MNIYLMTVVADEQLHIRIKPDTKADLRALADLHGLTMSGVVHLLIVRSIREEKERYPDMFPQERKREQNVNRKVKGPAGATMSVPVLKEKAS